MLAILKLLGKGLLCIILLPLGIAFCIAYGALLLFKWLFMLIRAIVMKAKGENPGLHDELESEAESILENSNIVKEQKPAATNVTYNINFNGQMPNQNQAISNQPQPNVIDYSEEIKQIEDKYSNEENK